jgi:hypothetical protein
VISVSAAFVKRRVSLKLCHKNSFKRQLNQIHGLLVTSSLRRRRGALPRRQGGARRRAGVGCLLLAVYVSRGSLGDARRMGVRRFPCDRARSVGHPNRMASMYVKAGDMRSRDGQTGRPARLHPGPVKPDPFWARPARHG